MTKAKPKGITWERFREECTPGLWTLNILSLELSQPGPVVRSTIPFPHDRQVEAGIARAGHPAGRYRVTCRWPKTKGDSWTKERKLLRMATDSRFPGCVVDVSRELVQAPPMAKTGPVDEARQEAEVEKHKAASAAARAQAKEAEKKIQRLEREDGDSTSALLQQLIGELSKPKPDAFAAMLPVLLATIKDSANSAAEMAKQQLERERASNEQRERFLETLLKQRETSQQNPMAALTESLKMVVGIKDLVTQGLGIPEGGGGSSEPKSELAELFDMVKEGIGLVMQLRQQQQQAPRPVAAIPQAIENRIAPAPTTNGHATTAVAAPPKKPGEERVRAFIASVANECANDADPTVTADKAMADGAIAMLPSVVRVPLEAGDWAEAWLQCQPFFSKDESDALALLMTPAASAWFAQFATALTEEPEDVKDE